jgi:hypothetical protein
MSSKKSSLPPYLQNLPPGIRVRNLGGGSFLLTVETDLALITCRYNAKHIEEWLKERVANLFEKAQGDEDTNPSAGVPDLAIYSGSNVAALIEVKERNVRSFDGVKHSKRKLRKESERYVGHALELFQSSFPQQLRQLPSLFLIQVLAVTLGDLDRSGILRTEGRVTKIINELFAEILKGFKDMWALPEKGRPRKWPKDKSPTAFLKVYNKALRDLNKIKEIYKDSSKSGNDPIDRVAEKYPDVPIKIVIALEHDAANLYSRKLASLRFKVEDGDYLDDVLSNARLEAKRQA